MGDGTEPDLFFKIYIKDGVRKAPERTGPKIRQLHCVSLRELEDSFQCRLKFQPKFLAKSFSLRFIIRGSFIDFFARRRVESHWLHG
jgi:hypothetical protein